MKRTALIAAIAIVFVATVGLSRSRATTRRKRPAARIYPAVVQRGEYLVKIMAATTATRLGRWDRKDQNPT